MAGGAKRTGGSSKKPPGRKPSGAAKPRPLRELSPAYRARIKASAKRAGITVAELRKRGSGAARGHAPRPGKTESQIRRERLDDRIAAWAAAQSIKFPHTDIEPRDIIDGVNERIRLDGVTRGFTDLANDLARLHGAYVENDYKSLGMNMDTLAERWDLPAEYLGYH